MNELTPTRPRYCEICGNECRPYERVCETCAERHQRIAREIAARIAARKEAKQP